MSENIPAVEFGVEVGGDAPGGESGVRAGRRENAPVVLVGVLNEGVGGVTAAGRWWWLWLWR